MKSLIIDLAGPLAPDFNQPLFEAIEKLGDYDVTWLEDVATNGDELFDNIVQSYDAIILSGVPLNRSTESVLKQAQLCNWLKNSSTPPAVGICAGMQIMSLVFGGQLRTQAAPEVGVMSTQILKPDPIFDSFDISQGLESYMMHSDETTAPTDFTTLARTELNSNSIMKHVHRPLYGFQFHPELHIDGHALLDNFATIATDYSTLGASLPMSQLLPEVHELDTAFMPA